MARGAAGGVIRTVAAIAALCACCAAAAEFPCSEDDRVCLVSLIAACQDADALRAIMLLARFPDEDSAAILAMELSSPDRMRATAALHALIQIGPPAVPVLLQAAHVDQRSVRGYAAYGLARIGRGLCAADLAPLAEDESAVVRLHAAAALETTGEAAAFPPLARLCEDHVISVRARAVRALGRIPHPDALDRIAFAMHDLYAEVANEAVYAMIAKGKEAITPLDRIAASGRDYEKIRACIALARIGEPGANPTLVRLLDHSDPRVVRAAIFALAATGDETTVRPLRFLRQPEREIDGVRLGDQAAAAIRAIESRGQKQRGLLRPGP